MDLNDQNLAYLVGVLRDGNITKNRIEFYSKNEKWLIKISSILYKLSGKKPFFKKVMKKNKTYFLIRLENKEFMSKLKKISEFKAPQCFWKTPSFILKSKKEIQIAYISGFFDAESNLDKHVKRSSWNISLYQAWNNVFECPPLEDIKKILLNEEINCNRITLKTKGRKNPLYCLRITSKISILKFSKLIFSYHPERLNKLNQIHTANYTPEPRKG